MPIVKSIALHDNVKATLKYILDPKKTEGLFLCNSLNCFTNAEDAYLNMKYIYETRRAIREHSDRTCLAFGVPYIETNRKRGLSYGEWLHHKQGTSWKEKIRRDIDTLVLTSKNFDELAATLEQRGYTIRYGERPAIKAPGQQRFVCFKTLGDDYTVGNINTRILWKDDLGNASRNDMYNNGKVLTICFAGIIAQLAKRIVEGKKREVKRDEELPYLPHNDRDVFQLGAQLALINKLNIHSIGELEAKMKEAQTAHDSAVREFNAITEEHHRLNDLLVQYENFRALDDKPDKTLSEKMKLQLAKQSLSRHGIKSPEDVRKLELQKQEYDERIANLKETMQTNTNLISAFKEIADTYNGISKGDYISNLMKSEQELEAERRIFTQERSAPKYGKSESKLPVQDIPPKPKQQESVQEKSEPKQDEPTQNPKAKTTSRGRKH